MSNSYAASRKKLVPPAFLFLLAGLLGGCALVPGIKTAKPGVAVALKERVFLSVEPFDAVVNAELERAGIEPARLEEEFVSELRYGLFLRGRTEVLDSTGATIVTVRATNLQPGFGNSGTSGRFVLTARRAGKEKSETAAWSWQAPVGDNPPAVFVTRHLARQAAKEVLARLQVPKDYEPPPPLHLMR